MGELNVGVLPAPLPAASLDSLQQGAHSLIAGMLLNGLNDLLGEIPESRD
jgi:hypothetical protein